MTTRPCPPSVFTDPIAGARPLTPETLVEIERIKQLKYRYARYLDTKEWAALRTLLTDDCVCDYSNGKYHHEGGDAVVAWIQKGMGAETFLSSHKMHHPEIVLTSDTTAVGIWALDDRVIDTQWKITIRGACFYRDEYVKQDGEWRIRHTAYRRVFEELEPRADTTTLTASWWESDGQSSLDA
jgi:hypothetical protein